MFRLFYETIINLRKECIICRVPKYDLGIKTTELVMRRERLGSTSLRRDVSKKGDLVGLDVYEPSRCKEMVTPLSQQPTIMQAELVAI